MNWIACHFDIWLYLAVALMLPGWLASFHERIYNKHQGLFTLMILFAIGVMFTDFCITAQVFHFWFFWLGAVILIVGFFGPIIAIPYPPCPQKIRQHA